MLYLILALIIAGAITALLTWVFSRGKEESPIIQPPAGDCGSCDGNDERCEMECMMEAATQAIEYYEDEELDDFRGRASDSYTEQAHCQDIYKPAVTSVKEENESHCLQDSRHKSWIFSITLENLVREPARENGSRDTCNSVHCDNHGSLLKIEALDLLKEEHTPFVDGITAHIHERA